MLTKLMWMITRQKTGVAKWVRDRAELYLDFYNDYSYDFHVNGESQLIERLKRFDIKTVMDVGANVGDWSLMASEAFPQARIFAFELAERTRKRLRENLKGNRFVIADEALGSSTGTITYKDYGDYSTVNTLTPTTYHDDKKQFKLMEAQLVRGDDFVKRHQVERIDLLKIDVEGAEFAVLSGFEETLKRGAVRVIQFEYGYANGDAKSLMKDFYSVLETAGYRLGPLRSHGVSFTQFTYPLNDFISGPNFVAVRHNDRELIETLSSRER